MTQKYHIDGTEEFGYNSVNRFLYSFYMYKNTVKRITSMYNCASVHDLKGYVAHFCYLRLKSFDTFVKVVLNNKDFLAANCILRMLGDSVAVFKLIYTEKDVHLLVLRHCLYVIDGCERNLKVLTDDNADNSCLPDTELEMLRKKTQYNRELRNRLMSDAKEMLESSPLRFRDKAAFDKIVEDRNWKFKEFKNYKKKSANQYQWKELYKLLDIRSDCDVLSFISQYTHGLSMSNLVMTMNPENIDAIVGAALSLIRRLHKYTLSYFSKEQLYILEGLIEPKMRNEILSCYDEEHRPDGSSWNNQVMNQISQLRFNGLCQIKL